MRIMASLVWSVYLLWILSDLVQKAVSQKSLTVSKVCREGFFLSEQDVCLPCNCKGHAYSCEDISGICIDCQNHTVGDFCEQCEDSFLPVYQPDGSFVCRPCACPISLESNNFADHCSKRGDFLRCVCQKGYAGHYCERCAPGYYGNPMQVGKTCKKCNCNGNTDPNFIFNECNNVTGQCLNCWGNTGGDRCEKCAPGFYGDAISAKDCSECLCDKCGTASCDDKTGVCHCKPGVTGHLCDKCEEGYSGFSSCMGCHRCECASAALRVTCHPLTNSCQCRPGAGGRYCERCLPGYWKYSQSGCKKCDCPEDNCDMHTGECLPKALDISECNINCDVCIWNLIGDIHQSNKTLDQVKNTVLNISTGAAANDRLKYYNYTANILQVQFSGWRNTYAVMRTEIGQLEKETQNVPTDMNFITTQGEAIKHLQEKVEKESHDSSTLANKLRTNLLSLNVFIEDMIRDWELYSVYQDIEPEEKKQKLVEAEQILSWMRNLHLSPKEPLTTEESTEASELLHHVQHLENLMKGTQKRLSPIQETLEQLNLRLFQAQSLLNKVDDTLQHTLGKYKTNQLKLQRREAQLQYVKNISNSVNQTVSLAKNTMSKANQTVDVVKEIVMKLREQHAEIDGALELMEKETNTMSPSSMHLVLRAEEHSDSLQRQADELQHNLKGSDANGHVEKALDALNVYDRIVNYLNDATVAGVTTVNISSKIHNSFEGLNSHLNLMYHQSVNVFREVSSLYSQQTEIENTVLDNKKYIDETNEMMKSLSQKVNKSSTDIQTIQKDLTPKRLQFTQEVSQATLNHSTEVLKKVMPIFNIVEKWNNNMRNEAYSTHAFDRVVLTAGEAVEDLSEILPELLNKLRVVEEKKPVNNISANIMNIRGLIAQARSVVKKVQVSMKFNGQSAVEVHSLSNLEELKTVTSISFYIRVDPDKDPIEDRFLLYLGDKKGNKDFMGLAIKSDNLVFLYNLGGEVVEIPLSSKPVSSWPPVFNLVKVERLGRHGKLFLTVPSQETLTEQKFIQKGEADGTDSLFDLDPKDTVFLVGGVPSDFKVPPALSLAPFVGCIELESLNNDLVSLYNFKRLHKMDFKTSVPCPRHKLAFSQSRVTSYLFDGSGFALVNNIEQRGKIGIVTRFDIEVRTVANNGILFLMVNEANFFVLKIKNGFLNLMYNFGFASGSVIMENNLPKLQINDARYHEVSVIYHHSKKIILLVDRSHVKSIENEKKPLPFSDIYIGGAPSTILKSRPELVSLVGLKGCVKGFQFQKKDFNLLEEPGTIGISSGCPEESFMSRQAHFKGDGYLSSTAKISPFQSFEGGFNFKTIQSSGLLFYYKDGVIEYSISLDNGAVVQLSNGTRVRSHKKNYNDGQNHFLVTSVTSQKYQLIIDDKDKQEKKKPLSVFEAKNIPQTFYFGGSPKSSIKNFTGCISYAYISRQDRDVEPEDFQRYSENANVLLQDCPLENPTALLLSKRLDNTSIRKSRTFSRKKRSNFVNTSMREMAFCDPSSFPQAIRHTYHYGGFTHSRQGYTGIASQIKKKFQIYMSLKTHSAFGVLLYLADKSEKNLVALLLKHGKLVLMFDSGQNQVQIRTQRRLNDGQWHDVVVNRSERMGRLIIDSLTVLEDEVPVRMFPQSSLEHLYVGGLPPGSGQKITQLAVPYFSGCLGNLQLNGRLLSKSSDRFGVTPCYEGPFESGIYFDEEGGFILLDDLIKKPQQLELAMEVRPRAAAGVLLHVFSKEKEYLTMYIYQRQVVAVVSNGSNEFSTTVGLKGICDGNWQKITVTMGATFVQLKVDSEVKSVEWAFSKAAPNSRFPFYVGGCPDVLLPSSGPIRKGYTGCMRNLSVNKSLVGIGKTSLVTGAVSVGRCPV